MDETTMIRIGDAAVCTVRRIVCRNGEPIPLSSRAFDILETLLRAGGSTVSKETLIASAWPKTVVEDNNLQVHICMIRKVLGGKTFIQTVHRQGYRICIGDRPTAPLEAMSKSTVASRLAPMHDETTPTVEAQYVLIIDDDDRFRASIGRLVASVGLSHLSFSSAAEFLDTQIPDAPACLLLDVSLPGVNGLALQEILNQRGEWWPIIFMTGYGTIPMTVQAMKAGATEFLTKPFRPDALIEIVRASLGLATQQHRRQRVLNSIHKRYASLTAREQEVMKLLVDGQSNKLIATGLGTTEVTIKVHKRRVLEKMSVKSTVELAQVVASIGAGRNIETPGRA
ncbi:response regulator [Pseudomonas sp. PP3]|uniref:response regulator n=1 Tax=Pseudomonas sp. PP3 TaxID=2815936 RepID=UPI001BAFD301|nr:response regulator [Pseudomonas sp. PP3]